MVKDRERQRTLYPSRRLPVSDLVVVCPPRRRLSCVALARRRICPVITRENDNGAARKVCPSARLRRLGAVLVSYLIL